MTTFTVSEKDKDPIHSRSQAADRLGSWLLVLSPLGFAVPIATGMAVVSGTGIGLLTDITQPQMEKLGASWILLSFSTIFGVGVGAVGVALVGASLRGPGCRWGRVAAGLAVAALLVSLTGSILRMAAGAFAEVKLGENSLYTTGWLLSQLFTPAVLATLSLCIGLHATQRLRRAAVVLVVLLIAYAMIDLASLALQFPSPPFVVSFLWLGLGISLLRRPRVP